MENRIMESLSIDCVIFGFDERLKVLLVKHREGISKGKWALPGGWIYENESIDEAAQRLLSMLTGLNDIYLEQLRAFGEVNRFPEGRVITVAYYSLIRATDYDLVAGFTASDARWFTPEEIDQLPYDHNQILDFAFGELSRKVRHEPIGFNLLPEKFTLLQLMRLYESALRMKLDKPNFRRKIFNMKLLVDCGEKQTNVAHRAARLYRFDQERYEMLRKSKFYLTF